MPDRPIRLPVLRRFLHHQAVLEIEPTLEVRTASGQFALVPFLFDTGTHFTTMSIAMGEELAIPFDTSHPVTILGTTGKAKGFLAPLWYSFSSLPQYQFESLCCFSVHSLKRPLLSLTDVLSHFSLKTLGPSTIHPLGSLLLRLRKGHKGSRREFISS